MGEHRNGALVAEIVARDGHDVVVVHGEIDLATVEDFRRAVDHAVDRATCQTCRIEVDLRDTTFMDATGLAVLLDAYRRLGQAHESVVLNDPAPLVLTLLESAGVASLFDIRIDIDVDDVLELFVGHDLRRRVEHHRPSGTALTRARGKRTGAGGPTISRSPHGHTNENEEAV